MRGKTYILVRDVTVVFWEQKELQDPPQCWVFPSRPWVLEAAIPEHWLLQLQFNCVCRLPETPRKYLNAVIHKRCKTHIYLEIIVQTNYVCTTTIIMLNLHCHNEQLEEICKLPIMWLSVGHYPNIISRTLPNLSF